MAKILNHAAMLALIEHQNWWFTASEVHGILSGLVAGNQNDTWRELLFPDGTIDDTAEKTMSTLVNYIERALASANLDYQLMLPTDVALTERAEALIFWVQGFKIAITSLREKGCIELDEACLEFVSDLDAFAELDTQLPDSEENNQLLTELEEHCRMGALMLYAYLHTPATPSSLS